MFGDIAGIGTTATERAEATGLAGHVPARASSTRRRLRFPLPGTFGNAGRNTIPGPDSFSLNVNMSRTFQLKERKSLEIQINSTNILNHPVPTSFGTTVGQSTYGVLRLNGMRRYQRDHSFPDVRLSMNKYKLIALATVFVAFEQVPAQVTFTSETKLIIVNVTVKDKMGIPVSNLKKEDFEITEDGKKQGVDVFEFEKLVERSVAHGDRR